MFYFLPTKGRRRHLSGGLGFLGIDLDLARNRSGERTISRTGSQARIEAIPTNEELMIAQHTVALIPVAQEA